MQMICVHVSLSSSEKIIDRSLTIIDFTIFNNINILAALHLMHATHFRRGQRNDRQAELQQRP